MPRRFSTSSPPANLPNLYNSEKLARDSAQGVPTRSAVVDGPDWVVVAFEILLSPRKRECNLNIAKLRLRAESTFLSNGECSRSYYFYHSINFFWTGIPLAKTVLETRFFSY